MKEVLLAIGWGLVGALIVNVPYWSIMWWVTRPPKYMRR